jgi:hypothetical protein
VPLFKLYKSKLKVGGTSTQDGDVDGRIAQVQRVQPRKIDADFLARRESRGPNPRDLLLSVQRLLMLRPQQRQQYCNM